MNKVWLIMILTSISVLLFINPQAILPALSVSGNKAVTLCFNLCAVYAVWTGIFNILEQTNISKLISKILSPLINLIFGKNSMSKESKQLVSMNMSANLLGMNSAATPLGIRAIKSMQDGTNRVNKNMVMLVIISCSSLQLLPTSIMGLMSAGGSKNASAIILPSLIASIFSTVIAIIMVKVYYKIKERKKKWQS